MRFLKKLKKNIFKKINILHKRLDAIPHRDVYLFILSFAIIFIIKFLQFPSLTYHAEMFAENGSNYFIHAYKDPVLSNLLTTDAGYLPLTQRIIAVIVVKGLHVIKLYPYVTQTIAITFIAAMSSLINLNIFKNFSSSALIRFILGIAIALISDYELNAFINFIYYGAILLFLMMFINKEKLHKLLLSFLSLIASLIILSKGQFAAFLPIHMFWAYTHLRKKQYKSFVYYLSTVFAGVIQLVVLYVHLPQHVESTNKLILVPYYGMKSLYYLVLTYRHVFFGYITKENSNLILIGLLLFLFVLGIKKVINDRNKQLITIFLTANIIAFCSLFLTVYVFNNNVIPLVTNLTKTVSNTKSVSSTPQALMKLPPTESSTNKSIFDVKHFANLRSLFISNLLIFLAGMLIIINIFPGKSQKIVVLCILIVTSGAFGQIKVEESYAVQGQSYSQWQYYYQLLDNKQFCIPLNWYPFLLSQNCDYLMIKDVNSPTTYTKPVNEITLSQMTPLAKNWEIQAIILINKPNRFSNNSPLHLLAYDKDGNSIGKAKQLVPTNYEYIYFLFDKPVSSIDKIVWKDQDNKTINVIPNILVFGKNKDVSQQRYEY